MTELSRSSLLGRLASGETIAPPAAPVYWPAWGREVDPWSDLARFVAPQVITTLGLRSAVHPVAPETPAVERDRIVAASRYETLRAQKIGYALDARVAPVNERQQIRDPEWILDAGVANCLDLAVTYASMCLLERVAPELLDGHGHALELNRRGLLHEDDWPAADPRPLPSAAFAPDGDLPRGVLELRDPAPLEGEIEAGRLLAVDVVAATEQEASFEDAMERARSWLQPGMFLIDVATLQELAGVENVVELPRPTARSRIKPQVPGGRPLAIGFASHAEVRAQLAHARGLAALIGGPGRGKSTIGRIIAADAPNGSGWFLDASGRQALINSLAAAELAERELPAAKLSDQTREGYAYAALGRLRNAPEPWVVVLDNADVDPSTLRGLLP